MLVDSHCHLGDAAFDADRAAVLARAVDAGVGHVVVVGDAVPSSALAVQLATDLPSLSATAGVHPHVAHSWNAEARDRIVELLAQPQVVAVGETGLDYHYDHSPREQQRLAFEAHLALGAQHRKPVVIHSRSADADMRAMVRDAPAATVLIMHSFAGPADLLDTALDRGAYVSFSGMVTFKSWEGNAWMRAVPNDRLLVETDAPYLAPVPHRGKRNEPGYVTNTAIRAAEVRGVAVAALVEQTTRNAIQCFGARVCPGGEDV